MTPRVSASAIGMSSGAAARAVLRRRARRSSFARPVAEAPLDQRHAAHLRSARCLSSQTNAVTVTVIDRIAKLVKMAVLVKLAVRELPRGSRCPGRRRCTSRRRPCTALAAAHLVQQRGDDPRAGAAERVADRDRAAVHVDLLRVELELVDAGDRLGGERLVELDQLQVLDPPANPGERAVHRGHRPDAHVVRVHACRGGADVAGERGEPGAVDRLLGHEQQGSAAVVQRGGVPAGHRAALAERGLLGGELLERDVRLDALVGGDLALAGGDRDDLGVEPARVAGGGGAADGCAARTRLAARG